ncbi:unnamed protein product [Symbiodinium sp. CCMP2592]|nr:unnamed protein product [Symbiodinium sp. CCMP2592]CAE7206015.1 unnamed protein product [Symbiodinium sp. CCMP2592]
MSNWMIPPPPPPVAPGPAPTTMPPQTSMPPPPAPPAMPSQSSAPPPVLSKETAAARGNRGPSYEARGENMRTQLANFSQGIGEVKTTLALHGEKMTEMHAALLRLDRQGKETLEVQEKLHKLEMQKALDAQLLEHKASVDKLNGQHQAEFWKWKKANEDFNVENKRLLNEAQLKDQEIRTLKTDFKESERQNRVLRQRLEDIEFQA